MENQDYAKLLKLTKRWGFLGLDNFYLKKTTSGIIKAFLFAFGLIVTIILVAYISLSWKESLQTAEELGRSASIRGPIANDTANNIDTNTAAKQLEYFLFAYNHAKAWVLGKYLASFIILGLSFISLVVNIIWWISCVILTKKSFSARNNGFAEFKSFFTSHEVIQPKYR